MCKLRAIDRILNNSYENIDERYTVIENSSDELAVARARAQLDLITKRLNYGNRIVMVCDLPDDIAEEIMDYSLKLIEEKMK